ncbi:hypothetical protein [Noviherbaspirillum galbum]|uniref:Lipoprotein n=1 Tax=Noviherbaspirillum galbum TaxID=2709383 RepID=A0A6B3ST85_9BURK|nr:hypothetical protein [Noviherbaspirillum galbum]NEX63977.1 hypothetical protein [Noviherbaspirillum galbum]
MTTSLFSARTLATLMLSSALAACGGSSHDAGISGTISGLTTGPLILYNGFNSINLGEGSTGFAFGTRLPLGTVYNVSITSVPSTLSCAVNNASGVATGDVNNVQVVCVPNNNLGGTVTGLRTSGLALTNGSDTVSVPANATSFVFSRRVGQGYPYGVTILTQPTGQTCSLANAVGTMGVADINSVQVTCS